MNKETKIYMYMENGELNFEKIVDDFSRYLWTIISNTGIYENDEIKEIMSDAFLILWQNQEKLDINKALSPYLVGIVKNLIKRYFYKFSKLKIENNIDDYEDVLLEQDGIDIIIEKNAINLEISKILNKMKSEEKDIFIDFYYEERKIKEIAIKYNYSESKIKTKLHRIRKKIRKELLKGGYSVDG